MERESQPARTGLTQALALNNDIWRASFYRFCQLLELENPDGPKLGTTSHPGDDPVRFRPWPGMGFPVSTLKAVEIDEDRPTLPPTIRTTFLGMYGVDSPLPTSWLDDIAQRREGHEALTSFLDIFSHRITTQYYRIWRKYAYPTTSRGGGAMPHRSVCWDWSDSVYPAPLNRWQRRFPVSWPYWVPCDYPPAMLKASGLW